MFDETEASRCSKCGHAEFMHYSNDPGFMAVCRGTYHDGPGLSDVVACKCNEYVPL